MSAIIAAAGPSAYWYLARGTGAVSLVLLTFSVVLGILGSLRFSLVPRWPRFAIDTVHRDISLLVLVLLAVHIISSVLDSFAPIRLTDAIIPFTSAYRPLWMGLGALAFDLLLALAVTSLLRRRLGYGTWRAIHWLAYLSWPVAVLHGLGTGSDTKLWWMLLLTAACVAAVLVALLVRISRAASDTPLRAPALVLSIAVPIGIAIFTLAGPLASHWARRAGTPARLLGTTFRPVAARVPTSARVSTSARGAARVTLNLPFSARLTGTATQIQEPGGAIVDLSLRLSGGAHGRLRVRLAGAPMDGGGLAMTGSQVDLVADGIPSVLEGRVVSLQGDQLAARVSGGAGDRLDLHANLNIDQTTRAVSGTLRATKAGG
jgi:methionine sulfoxide reductase heme-binding subunit